jgi:acetoin utilization deacetylase AcuC-like enzyme
VEIDLADGTGDTEYLEAVGQVAERVLERARPEMCFYLAGADPWEGDRLGRLAVTRDGLAARDMLVRDLLREAAVPVVVVLAGGYGEPIEGTVAINARTVRLFAGS